MKIASWNINSLRKRQDRLFAWLETAKPDVVCLQETKCPDEQFPVLALQAAGYHSAYRGEKSYNGVAILSKLPPMEVRASLGDEVVDPQTRVIAATVGPMRVYSIYAPNGQAVGSPAFGETGSTWKRTTRISSAWMRARAMSSGMWLMPTGTRKGLFSWWDYRMLAFPKNRGLRIDAILANRALAEKCTAAGIDREMRKGKDPSDHAPVWAEFEF